MFHGLGFRVSGLQGRQADESCLVISAGGSFMFFYMEPAS